MAFSIRNWIENIGIKWIVMLLWTAVCGLLFWTSYTYYKYDPSFFYVHQMLGSWLCLSRGSATVLNLNCGLVLIPMCRSFITALRGLQQKIRLHTMHLILDSCKGFHIACAYIIVISSAHLFNARNFSRYYNRVYPKVNAASYQDQNPIWIVVGTVPGATGILMMLILCLIVTSSTKNNRINNFDLFWYSHRLFVMLYILLLIHAFRGPIRKQVNTVHHTPGCNFHNVSIPWPEPEYFSTVYSSCDEEPKFGQIGCRSWVWVSGPILLYLCDVAYRLLRRSPPLDVIQTIRHADDVVELRMIKDDLRARPGQYILLQCPAISCFEWHPYSLTRCSTKRSPVLSVHVRARGDWSERLMEYLRKEDEDFVVISESGRHRKLKLNVDGPFCSPMEDVSNYRSLVCVAGGIGITPFASFLNAIRETKKYRKDIERLTLIWINKKVNSFSWFGNVIYQLHQELWESNRPDLLDVRFHFTTMDNSLCQDLPEDCREFIRKRLTHGRPVWKDIFQEVAASHRGCTVGVFACGPKELIQTVKLWSWKKYPQKTSFRFYEEFF